MKVYLYLLERDPDNHDEMTGCVVAATNFEHARGIAADNACDEGETVWLSTDDSSCLVIGSAACPEGMVLAQTLDG